MPPVVVVSDRFWRTHLGADPHAVGRGLRLNGSMATIVGIGPKDFLGIWPQSPADLFVPVTCGVSLAPELSGDPLHRSDREIFRVVFRLAHGVTLPAAEAALDAMTRNIDQETGARHDRDRKGRVVRLMPAGTVGYATPEQHALVDTFNVVLWALVLSLVCANLASLLLARGSQRRREIAIRLSVGASRMRLVRQFLTESVLLSFAGGLAGIVLAYWITHVLSSLPLPSQIPLEFNCQLDFHVLAITLAIALAAGIGFGLAPALSSTRTDIGVTLKEGAQAPLRGYRRFGLRNLFVVGQMAASLMLLLVTWFVALAFLSTARMDTGVEVANLNLVSLDPVRDGYSAERAAALFREPARRARARQRGSRRGVDRQRCALPRGRYPRVGSRRRREGWPGTELGLPRAHRGKLLRHARRASGGRARVRPARPGTGWAAPSSIKPPRARCSAPRTRLAAAFARGNGTTRWLAWRAICGPDS